MTDTQTIIASVDKLPTIPVAFGRLSALMNDERATMADFSRVLEVDVAFTASVLRLVNSAAFARSREVTSVRHALMMLGTKQVFNLAAGLALAGVLPETIPGFGLSSEQFWTHSIAVAVFAERLAVECDVEAPDVTFTAGLLHDIGKIASGVFLAQHIDDVQNALCSGDDALVDIEVEVLGISHAEVGAELALRWNLPPGICNAVRWHHDPDNAPADQSLVDLVHVADALAHTFGLGADVGELSRSVQPGVCERLGIRTSYLEHAAMDALARIRVLEQVLTGA